MTDFEFRPTGAYFLPGSVEHHYGQVLDAGVSLVSCNSENVDWVEKFTQRADPYKTRVQYISLIPDFWNRYLSTWQYMPAEDAATEIYSRAGRNDQGISLDDLFDIAYHNGHQLIVDFAGEIHYKLLNDLDALRRFADISLAFAQRVAAQEHEASILRFSTGTMNLARIAAVNHALNACRYMPDREPYAWFAFDEYASIWPTTWMGINQTDRLGTDWENITDEMRFAALLEDPYMGNFEGPISRWQPAWLMSRPWGHGNPDGTFGFPLLHDVRMLLAEWGIDYMGDLGIPLRGDGEPFTGVQTVQGAWHDRLGFSSLGAGIERMCKLGDAFYTRLRLPNGQPQVPLREVFCGGPGHGWDLYDFFATDDSANGFISYANQAVPNYAPMYPFGVPQPPIPPTPPSLRCRVWSVVHEFSGTMMEKQCA